MKQQNQDLKQIDELINSYLLQQYIKKDGPKYIKGLQGIRNRLKKELRLRLRERELKANRILDRKKILLELASKNINLKEFDKTELSKALIRYEEVGLARPCCSKYPGTWPFCDSGC